MGYRNAFIYPERVLLMNIFSLLQNGEIKDPIANELLAKQARDFCKFIKAIQAAGLDANTVNSQRPPKK